MHELHVSLHRQERLEARLASPDWRRSMERLSAEDVLAQVLGVDAEHCQRLTLTGCPLEHPEWRRILAGLRDLGFRHFAIETDAAPLADARVIQELSGFGVEWFFLWVGGIRQRVYETVLQDPGTFKAAMRGLHEAIGSGVRAYVVAPVLRWNREDLSPLLDWLVNLERKPAGFLLALPEIARLPPGGEKLLLPYSQQAEVADDIFRACQGHRIEYGFFGKRGILPCAAGGHLERFATVFWERLQFMRHRQDEDLVRVEACGACSLAQSCGGVERAYLDAFGPAEMKPVPFEASSGWKLRKHNSLEQREFRNVSPYENDEAENPMALVRINGHCNMSCSFCFIDRTVPDFDSEDLLEEIHGLHERGARHLVLSGGEPTIHPDLPEIIRRSKSMGYRVVELQSNGVRSAEMDYARSLREAGLDEVCVSLHSANPEKSDEITRLPKAFWKTVQSVHNFQELGLVTKFAHVITELNYRELPDTVRFLAKEFPPSKHYWSICFGIAQPISDLVFSWVIPRFSDVRPYMRAALDLCLEAGIGFGGMVGEGGYPPCMLDGDMKYYAMNLSRIYRSPDLERRFYKAPRCRECSFDAYCHGVRRDYVEFYGDSEIVPFQAEIAGPTGRRDPGIVTKGLPLVQLGPVTQGAGRPPV
jgi:MoaA/NifB/PqqE/SkfB family radical SAM enzyme